MNRRIIWIILVIVAAGAAIGLVDFFGQGPPVSTTKPSPATVKVAEDVPATAPAKAVTAAGIHTYGELLHAELKHYPTTKPWASGVDLTYAAHIVLRDPVYVCPQGDLWITRTDADPLSKVLARAGDETEHITSAAIRYIVWTKDKRGHSLASAIVPTAGGYDLVSTTDRLPLPAGRDYQWDRAMTWMDEDAVRLIVPTPTGVSILTIGKTIGEQYQDLVEPPAPKNVPPPQVLFDLRGILAWIPADGAFHGPATPARYVDGKWLKLDSDDWKQQIIHLVPMLDGSVLQVRRAEGDSVELAIVPLDSPVVDRAEITKLVGQLDDDDSDTRKAAFERLTQFGPGIFPILRELQPNALAEGQARINELTHGKLAAKLGGIEINDMRLSVFARLPDGGIIFLAPSGITIPHDGAEPREVIPDYLVIQPGRAVEELPAELVAQIVPGATISWLHDEWIITTENAGPSRFLPPNRLAPLLRNGEESFTQPVAIDIHSRWILRNPKTSSTQPSETLILDPTVPDPSPRIALWGIDNGTEAGWNAANWPVFRRNGDLWAITAAGWELMPKEQILLTDPPPATRPTTMPTTMATTAPSTRPADDATLLYTASGDRYQDGKHSLIVTTNKGDTTTWPLPDIAATITDSRPWLIETNDGSLFLINDADRITRIRRTPDEIEPFEIAATFTAQLPHFGSIKRAWLDPAGRIDIVYDENRIAIIFPTGQVPAEIAPKILLQDLRISEPK